MQTRLLLAGLTAFGGDIMTLRGINTVGVAFSVLVAVYTSPARAVTLNFDLSISYDLSAPGPLNGVAAFSLLGLSVTVPEMPLGNPIVVSLAPGDNFVASFLFEPPEPCLTGLALCQADFSFGGLAGNLTAYGFGQLSDATPFPSSAPIIPIGDLYPPNPCLMSCELSGPLVADGAPLQVGEWEVTITATPLPPAITLFGAGASLLGLLGWRRKRRAQAVA